MVVDLYVTCACVMFQVCLLYTCKAISLRICRATPWTLLPAGLRWSARCFATAHCMRVFLLYVGRIRGGKVRGE